MNVTKENIFQALNGSGPAVVNFEGCTGMVSFDPSTGSRSVAAEVPDYDLVSLTPSDWEVTCRNQFYLMLWVLFVAQFCLGRLSNVPYFVSLL